MLTPVSMSQLRIIVSKAQLHNFFLYAGREETLHVISSGQRSTASGEENYDISNLAARSSSIKNRIASLSQSLPTANSPAEQMDAPVHSLEGFADFLEQGSSQIERIVKGTEDSIAKLNTELERNKELSRLLRGLREVGITLDALSGEGFQALLAGEIDKTLIPDLRKSLDDLTYGNLVFVVTGQSQEDETFLVILPKIFRDGAKQTITSLGGRVEDSWADLPRDPDEALGLVEGRLSGIEQSSKLLEHQLEINSKELAPKLKSLVVFSEILDTRVRALAGSTATESTIVLEGWVPRDRVARFSEGAAKACNGLVSVHIATKDSDHENHREGERRETHSGQADGQPPTLVRTPGWAGPLQSVINNFGVPSYREANPLLFMIFSYPIIYGMMFGDFGEGPIFMLVGLLLLRLKKKGKKLGDIFQPMVNGAELIILLGIGITAFGLLFGDFFGFESKDIFGFHGLFSPTEGALHGDIANLLNFMGIVLIFGVSHYSFGLILSVYNKLRLREYSEAFFGPVCWLWFYLAGVYAIARFVLSEFNFGALTGNPLLLVLVFVPFLLMGWKEGGLHAFEAFLSGLSHTLSYLRIWALNIADFFLKYALFSTGAAFGVPIVGAILGNILVMIIEGLIVFVQTLRLHWVEWFSKFYEGAGLPFAPYQEPAGWSVHLNG